jgi:hypothetical protein
VLGVGRPAPFRALTLIQGRIPGYSAGLQDLPGEFGLLGVTWVLEPNSVDWGYDSSSSIRASYQPDVVSDVG